MKRIDFDNGKITTNIFQAAIPMLIAQILSLLYNIVDRIYIARIPDIGTTALGAVGLCFPIIVIITAFSNLFGSGGAPIFAIERGRNDTKRAGMIMNTSFFMLTICSILLMCVGFLFARPILTIFGASDNALIYAYPYIMIYLIGTFPSMIATGMNPFINAQGYATTGMISVIIGAIANIVLDPLFIFVFHLGIRGAAIATVLSQCLSAGFVFYFLSKKAEYKIRLLHKEEIKNCGKDAKNIVSLGTAGFVMQLTNSLVTICCNNVLAATGGDVYVSVMTIISSVRQMIETPIWSISEGSSPIISYNYGAGNKERVKATMKRMILVCLTGTLLLAGVAIFAPQIYTGLFTDNKELLELTCKVMPVYFLGISIFGIQCACQTSFISLGQAKVSLFIALLRKIILLIPLAVILPKFMGVMGIYRAEPIADVISVLTTSAVFIITVKKVLRNM